MRKLALVVAAVGVPVQASGRYNVAECSCAEHAEAT